jgi:hypothetical protein
MKQTYKGYQLELTLVARITDTAGNLCHRENLNAAEDVPDHPILMRGMQGIIDSWEREENGAAPYQPLTGNIIDRAVAVGFLDDIPLNADDHAAFRKGMMDVCNRGVKSV